MSAEGESEIAQWARSLEVGRAAKDAAFRQSPDSPVSAADRPRFRGLEFFPPDAGMRYRLALQPSPSETTIQMEVSRGTPRRFRRVGYFEILLAGTTVRLWAYRSVPAPEEDQLFVPFRDATSGKESYGAGRYLDVVARESGEYDLDFNEAYNPYCAYSDSYSCPFPPPENWLTAPVRAGERMPKGLGSP
ncbi:MAG: DUF1684 domain-containing protein [Thermoplasmata archaeon]|nr:DUF1684 domain-containing protein [Thermoplasmata archaeon]